MSESIVEKYLGRRLDERARGAVPTLNDIDDEMLAEARALARRSKIAALQYLEYHVRRGEPEYGAPFIDEALLTPDVSVRDWGRCDILCHWSHPLSVTLRATVSEIMAAIPTRADGRWFRVRPETERCGPLDVGGAPGTIVRGARYWWKPETNDYDGYWIDPEGDDIESITDIEMAMRRWIASRVALELRGSIESMRTPADVCRHLDAHRRIAISAEDMSEDAEQAIRGLLATHNSGEPGVPGFTGPDSAFSR